MKRASVAAVSALCLGLTFGCGGDRGDLRRRNETVNHLRSRSFNKPPRTPGQEISVPQCLGGLDLLSTQVRFGQIWD